MKVLFIYLSDFTGNSSRDRLKSLISQWLSEGNQVTLLTTLATMKYFLKIYSSNEITFICSNHIKEIESPTTFKIIITYILRLSYGIYVALNNKYDSVYSITGLITETVPGFIFRLLNKKCYWIVLIDNLVPKPFSKARGSKYIVKILAFNGFLLSTTLLKKTDRVFTVNKVVKDYLEKKNIQVKERITLTTNGINLDEIDAIQNKDVVYDGLYLGRLDEGKGLLELVDIWKTVNQVRGVKTILAIAGSGTVDFENKLKKKILKEGLENTIFFVGFKAGAEKIRLFKSSKVFVFPSKDESYPIVFLEALACGLPIVSYDLPAYLNVFPGDVYKASKIGDHEKFSELVVTELSVISSNRLKAGNVFARNLDWSVVTAREYLSLK